MKVAIKRMRVIMVHEEGNLAAEKFLIRTIVDSIFLDLCRKGAKSLELLNVYSEKLFDSISFEQCILE